MNRIIRKSTRWITTVAGVLMISNVQAEDIPSIVLVTDNNTDVVKVNFQCDIPTDCAVLEERINRRSIKSPFDVAVGKVKGKTYALVNSGSGKKYFIDLYIPSEPFWDKARFASVRADTTLIMKDQTIVTANNASSPSILSKYTLGTCDGPIVPGCWNMPVQIGPVMVGAEECQEVVEVFEEPRGTLVTICSDPRAAVSVSLDGNTQITLLDETNFGSSPNGGAIATTGFGKFLLISSKSAVRAFLQDGASFTPQSQAVITLTGIQAGLSTGLCADGSNCATISQSGNDGALNLVALSEASNGDIVGTVIEVANNDLANPGSTAFANQASATAADCDDGCPLGQSTLIVGATTLDPNTNIGASTEGVFIDTRVDSDTGDCLDAALDLTPTGIPDLAGTLIDPAFCADNGQFTIDVYEDDAIPLFFGTVEWRTPGECWETGLSGFPPLNTIEYGLWASDLEERFDNEDQRIDQFLIGCNGRRRGGASLSFVIEGFTGRNLFAVSTPDSHLYPYGHRELVETIEIATQDSACFMVPLPVDPTACDENLFAWNQALVGWDMQAFAGQTAPVRMDLTFTGGAPSETQSIGLATAGLDMTLKTNGANLNFEEIAGFSAIGVAGGSGEIDVGESIEVSLSSTPMDPTVTTTITNVPFRVPSFTMAFMFDGPESDAVENEIKVTATLQDGGNITGVLKIGFDNVPTWSGPGGTIMTLSPPQDGSAGVFKVHNNPFGDVIVTSLDFEPLEVAYDLVPPGYDCPTGHPNSTSCTNQSDASIYEVEVEVIERLNALAYTYDGLLESLCAVSTRPASGRPAICSSGPFVMDFNGTTGDNVAGRLQVSAEALARFVGHNICLLDSAPAFDPAFCATAPPWSIF